MIRLRSFGMMQGFRCMTYQRGGPVFPAGGNRLSCVRYCVVKMFPVRIGGRTGQRGDSERSRKKQIFELQHDLTLSSY
jgi:hypothetical protein